MHTTTCDAAVAGAGVFGVWTAYRLARTGRSVVLLDALGVADPRASSGAESRLIRAAYGASELYTRFAVESLEAWKEIVPSLFRPTGAVWFDSPQSERLAASREALDRAGVRFEALDAAEIRRRYSQVRLPEDVAGIFEPDAGVILAGDATRAVSDAAQQLGVQLLHERIATPVRNGEVFLNSGDRLIAETFVFACGAWLPKLFPQIHSDVITPTRQELFFFQSPGPNFSAPDLPAWIDETDPRVPYCFPDIEQHGVKVGFHHLGPPFDPDTGDRTTTEQGAAEMRTYIAARMPGLANTPLIASRVCQYENTPTGDFLIDRHREFPNIWFAGGGSGHGFKHGPAVGRYIVDRLENRGNEEPAFSLESKLKAGERSVI